MGMNPLAFLNPYMLLIKISGSILTLIAIYFAWNHYIAEPYRAEGRAEIQIKLDKSTQSLNICTDDVKKQNAAVQLLAEDSAKRTESGVKALKLAKANTLHQQDKINALQSELGKLTSCDSAVEIAKSKL